MPAEQRNPLQEYQVMIQCFCGSKIPELLRPLADLCRGETGYCHYGKCLAHGFESIIHIFSCFCLQSCFQVAHTPGALFFDVDGISDRTSSVSSALLLVHLLLITTKSYKLHVSTYRCLFALFSLLILF